MNEFEQYFSEQYRDQWDSLLASLKVPEQQICFSAFAQPSQNVDEHSLQNPGHKEERPRSAPASSYPFTPSHSQYPSHLINTLYHLELYEFKDHTQAMQRHPILGHIENYILDPASLAPVAALEIGPNDQVLDLCAAPGGKSLGLLSQLGEQGQLISNDSSESRFHRLRKVLKQYTPPDHPASYKVLNKDGTKFGFYFPQSFTKILVDVPCSSERHHIHQNNTHEWSLKASKRLAQKQYTLLCAALLCAKAGAHIVYSTCSINPIENDEVIAKFLKKKKAHVELAATPTYDHLGVVPTQYGQMILPHIKGFGPIYYCKLKVTSALDKKSNP